MYRSLLTLFLVGAAPSLGGKDLAAALPRQTVCLCVCGKDVCGSDVRGKEMCGEDECGKDVCGKDLAAAFSKQAVCSCVCGEDVCGKNVYGKDVCGKDMCGKDRAAVLSRQAVRVRVCLCVFANRCLRDNAY